MYFIEEFGIIWSFFGPLNMVDVKWCVWQSNSNMRQVEDEVANICESEHCSVASRVYPESAKKTFAAVQDFLPNFHPIFQQGVVDTCLSFAWLAALQAFPNLDGASNCQHVHQRHYDNFFCLANASWQRLKRMTKPKFLAPLLQSWWLYSFLGHQIQFVGSFRVSYSATESNGHRERESWHSSCAAFQCDGACAFRGLQLAFYTGERSRFQVEEWETHSTSSYQHVG